MSDLEICSNNVKGLQNFEKRRKIFYNFHVKKSSIIMLQETHSTKECEDMWRAEWGGKIYFAHGDSDARGVCILLKNDIDFEVENCFSDENGRYLILDSKIQGKKITLCNIYGPNKDNPDFFAQVHNIIESIPNDCQIIGGDFNCILDNAMDKKGGRSEHSNKKAQNFLNDLMDEYELVDIWRQMHPNLSRFTYHQRKPISVFTRLDFYLISYSLCGFVNKASILPGYLTDHSMITLNLSIVSMPRGPGFWKLNKSLLSDPEYVSMVKDTVKTTCELDSEANAQLLWDVIKTQIRGNGIHRAKN